MITSIFAVMQSNYIKLKAMMQEGEQMPIAQLNNTPSAQPSQETICIEAILKSNQELQKQVLELQMNKAEKKTEAEKMAEEIIKEYEEQKLYFLSLFRSIAAERLKIKYKKLK